MITIKSIRHALQVCEGQLNAQQLIDGQLYLKGKGWKEVKLTNECKTELVDHCVKLLGGWKKTKNRIRSVLTYSTPQHWGLRRIIFDLRRSNKDRRKKKVCAQYVAGQDYVAETRSIRNFLK